MSHGKRLQRAASQALATGALLAAALPAAAASIVVNHVVDLSGCVPTPPGGACSYQADGMAAISKFASSMLVSQGDHVTIHVSFAPGQRIELMQSRPDSFSMFSGWLSLDNQMSPPNGSIYTIDNVFYALAGVDGSISGAFGSGPQTSGSSNLGATYQKLMQPGDAISFTGYTTSFDVVSLQYGSLYYEGVWLAFNADQLSVQVSAVPESNSSLLLTAGLAGLVPAVRRRRRMKDSIALRA